MSEEKKELLSQLYTLRAGLSVISQERDKEQAIDEEVDDKIVSSLKEMGVSIVTTEHYYDERTKKYREKKKNREDYIDELNEEIDSVLSDKHADIIRKQGKSNSYESDYQMEDSRKAFKKWFILFCISSVLLVTGIILILVGVEVVGTLFVPGGVLGFVGFGIPMLFSLSHFLFWRKSYNRENKQTEEKCRAFEEGRSRFIPFYENLMADKEQRLIPITRRAKVVYDMLKANFAETLDERDWQYVDLIIYYFETKRAVTLREALQLVDREVQTQAIITSLEVATREICNTIQREMSALRRTIEAGFDRISAQLGVVAELQLIQLEKTDLTNALLAKSASSSSQLARDVSYMRNHW